MFTLKKSNTIFNTKKLIFEGIEDMWEKVEADNLEAQRIYEEEEDSCDIFFLGEEMFLRPARRLNFEVPDTTFDFSIPRQLKVKESGVCNGLGLFLKKGHTLVKDLLVGPFLGPRGFRGGDYTIMREDGTLVDQKHVQSSNFTRYANEGKKIKDRNIEFYHLKNDVYYKVLFNITAKDEDLELLTDYGELYERHGLYEVERAKKVKTTKNPKKKSTAPEKATPAKKRKTSK
jgi:hypothetical protein